MNKEISISEVKNHKNRESTWIIIDNIVYDVTSFLGEHPGGEDSLLEVAGRDGTQAFEDVGHSEDARELMKKYKIGKIPLAEHTKTVASCCPTDKIKKSKKNLSPRTYDGSPSSSYHRLPRKMLPKEPLVPRAERRVQSIVVPRESSNLKWALIALASAVIIGFALKKYMG